MTGTALLTRLRDDQSGLALIEFAFAVPILFILFVGGFQSMDAISAYRKVTTTVRAMSDLTTQNTSITVSGAQQILAASQQIMAPYPTSRAQMRITEFQIDALGNATVVWSQTLNGTAYAKNTVLANTGVSAGTYIYSEINYQYVPGVASKLIGPVSLRDTIYMSPRNSASIPCGDCS